MPNVDLVVYVVGNRILLFRGHWLVSFQESASDYQQLAWVAVGMAMLATTATAAPSPAIPQGCGHRQRFAVISRTINRSVFALGVGAVVMANPLRCQD
jgi:hypothetical protein